jgi:Domain of unknown function (DUF4872)
MTKQKTFKRRVRERMEHTGESYATARAQLTGSDRALPPGLHPHTASLRVALADAGIDVSEELTLLMTGGAGAAAMAFRYDAEDFTSFHLSGWNPFQSDIRDAVRRLGLEPDIHEAGGAVTAARALRERLPRVQVAWVERYDVIAVLAIEGDEALVYDLVPRRIAVEQLAARRAAVRKDRHRLMAIGDGEPDVAGAVRAGLARCAAGPERPPSPGMSLDGIARWADRLHGGRGKESWARMFPPGKHLDGALRSMRAGIDAYGGGLMRPMQARALREAAALLDIPALLDVADRTDSLAAGWNALPAEPPLDELQRLVFDLYAEELATRESLAAVL